MVTVVSEPQGTAQLFQVSFAFQPDACPIFPRLVFHWRKYVSPFTASPIAIWKRSLFPSHPPSPWKPAFVHAFKGMAKGLPCCPGVGERVFHIGKTNEALFVHFAF
eukprot:9481071-Pyramimonas_sp.AAC.2